MIVDGAEGERGAIVIVRLAPDAAVLDDAGAGLEREDYRGEQRLHIRYKYVTNTLHIPSVKTIEASSACKIIV